MKRISILLIAIAGFTTQLFAEDPAPTPAADNDSVLPIQEQNLGFDPTRLQTMGTGSFEYRNLPSKAQDFSLRAGGDYRFSFLDDNRRWWGVSGSVPITMHQGGKWGASKTGLGDLNLGVRRVFPGDIRQVGFVDVTWMLGGQPGLSGGHSLIAPGYGLSMNIADKMQFAGTVTYVTDIGSKDWSKHEKIRVLHFKPMILYGLSDVLLLKGAFDVGYSLTDGVETVPYFRKVNNKLQLTPSVTAGYLLGDDHRWMAFGTFQMPLDKFQIGYREQYSLKVGANYFFD